MPNQRPPSIDPIAASRWLNAPTQASAWLHEEVAQRMAERLDVIRLQPKAWADWQSLKGGVAGHALVAACYPDSDCFVVDVPANQAKFAIYLRAKPWWNLRRHRGRAVQFALPPDAGVQMVWANMGLHMAPDPQALMAQWHKALAVDGFLMFSCLGPDTLRGLRHVYQGRGWGEPAHEFTDMHDWGDMLVAAGFAEPVMDMERITLSFATPERLLEELRSLGKNLHIGRFAGLRGRTWLRSLKAALAAQLPEGREGGRLTLTFEVIYGHALKPVARLPVRPETSLSLDEMRQALQRGQTRRAGG